MYPLPLPPRHTHIHTHLPRTDMSVILQFYPFKGQFRSLDTSQHVSRLLLGLALQGPPSMHPGHPTSLPNQSGHLAFPECPLAPSVLSLHMLPWNHSPHTRVAGPNAFLIPTQGPHEIFLSSPDSSNGISSGPLGCACLCVCTSACVCGREVGGGRMGGREVSQGGGMESICTECP